MRCSGLKVRGFCLIRISSRNYSLMTKLADSPRGEQNLWFRGVLFSGLNLNQVSVSPHQSHNSHTTVPILDPGLDPPLMEDLFHGEVVLTGLLKVTCQMFGF